MRPRDGVREKAHYGIYGPSGNILRQGTATDERYVGWAVSASLDWNPNRFGFFGLVYTHAFAGAFIEKTGPSEDIDFVEVTFRVRFWPVRLMPSRTGSN